MLCAVLVPNGERLLQTGEVDPLVAELAATGLGICAIYHLYNDEAGEVVGSCFVSSTCMVRR